MEVKNIEQLVFRILNGIVVDSLIIQALARAVYSRGELVLLDDVLSGLDSKTENAVFHSLLGREGLLRRAGMTILLASSDG